MTLEEFNAGLALRLRNVLQKHAREQFARHGGGRLGEANTNLDAAIQEFNDFVFDAIDASVSALPAPGEET